jgi:hypothetical protein
MSVRQAGHHLDERCLVQSSCHDAGWRLERILNLESTICAKRRFELAATTRSALAEPVGFKFSNSRNRLPNHLKYRRSRPPAVAWYETQITNDTMNPRNRLAATVLAAACITLSLVGCNKGVSDQTLATDIQAKLFADPNAKTANVKVGVANGVVTLTGDAPTSDIALQVVNIANGTTGVKSVNNQLQIDNTPAASAAATPPPVTSPTPQPMAPPVMAQNPPPPAPQQAADHDRDHMRHEAPVTVTIPAGTDIGVRMIDGVSSKTNTAGQTFRASLSSPVVIHGRTILPSGADATVLLDAARGAGRIKGSSELEVRLIKMAGYDVDSSVHDQAGHGRGKQTAVRTGIGAAAGAIIGALAGGGRGAAIGSLAGGGAGAGIQLATHGQQVSIPSETRLTFSLRSPIVVTLHHDHGDH